MSFAKLSTATRLRDVVTSIVKRTLAAERPVDAYGLVQSVNYVTRKAVVVPAGSTGGVTVSFGTIQPLVGQIARIAGPPQDRYVSDVILAPPQLEVFSLLSGGIDILGAWTAYTPSVLQSVAVTKNVTYAKYVKIGRTVIVVFRLEITSAGTVGHPVRITLPFTAASTGGAVFGAGYIYDQSGAVNYGGMTAMWSTTDLGFIYGATSNAFQGQGSFGFDSTKGLASGDALLAFAIYESAT